jgi:CubicO group peptidase (beta-lactamase class C family)
VFSVTKSVVSILIGMAIEDGLNADIDQPLADLLPKHREAMRVTRPRSLCAT